MLFILLFTKLTIYISFTVYSFSKYSPACFPFMLKIHPSVQTHFHNRPEQFISRRSSCWTACFISDPPQTSCAIICRWLICLCCYHYKLLSPYQKFQKQSSSAKLNRLSLLLSVIYCTIRLIHNEGVTTITSNE